jgi:hypothetical protein
MLALDAHACHALVCFGAVFRMENIRMERWRQLCEEAANEQDPQKRSELVYQLHLLLREKEARETGKLQKPKDAA